MNAAVQTATSDRFPPKIVIGLIAIHFFLVGWCAFRNSFSWTETGLLPAGILDWRYASFDVFRVNPPLVRMWASLPVLAFDPDIPFKGVSVDPRRRAEWDVARSMIDTNGQTAWMWLTVARLWCLPFVWAGMWVAWRWSSQLFGRSAGIGCILLWTFSPLMIGYDCLISGDAQAACMGLVTLYVFRQWVGDVRLETSYILGTIAGLTVLTKTSWMALLGLLPLLWVLIRISEFFGAWYSGQQRRIAVRGMIRETGLAIGSMGVCLLVINLAYGFDGSFKRLDSFEFISKALTADEGWQTNNYFGNRFADSWLGLLPVPLPEDMVIGMDLQKWDFDRERWSYFQGEWRNHGWWYYYLYALAVKAPLGFWLLLLMAVVSSVHKKLWRTPWRDLIILLLPIVIILSAASAETGLNRHVRYVLPIVPLSFVLVSPAFLCFDSNAKWMRRIATLSIAWLICSSLWIYPHSHSYFNELISGPLQASDHFNASNLDWGQDLQYVKTWCEQHPDRRPVFVKSYLHLVDPAAVGIPRNGGVPSMQTNRWNGPAANADNQRFPPGWYIIDNESLLRQQGDYLYLRNSPHDEQIGYGFRVYEVTPAKAATFQTQQELYWANSHH